MNATINSATAIDNEPLRLSTREGYDRWSEIYDVEDNPLIALEEPRVAFLLGDVAGLAVADIGCGTGRHSLRLANQGATVSALDFSAGMLSKARAKAADLPIDFIVHDLEQPFPFEDDSFDRVLCALVLEHIRDLRSLFREMDRICRPEGAIVVTAMHPAMMLRGVQARFRDPSTGQEIRPASEPNRICDFVGSALAANLRIDHIGEWSVDRALAERMERAAKYLDWPMLFEMRLVPTRSP